jgi:hypothetical protein
MSEPFDQSTDTMIFYAFRYCLGRATCAVTECVDYLIKHWGDLSTDTQVRIHSEIKRAFERGRYGHECDREDWQRVLNLPVPEGK